MKESNVNKINNLSIFDDELNFPVNNNKNITHNDKDIYSTIKNLNDEIDANKNTFIKANNFLNN